MTFYNKIVDKRQLKKLISWTYSNYGSARCAQVADKLKEMGFRYATQAGVSISVEDLQVPPVKREMLDAAEAEIQTTEDRYAKGEITEVERFQKVIDTWNGTSEALKEEVVRNFRETNPLNSVYMMAFSGARGNLSQVRQLVGMRGLMADPQGEIIALPIKTNFREGLTVTEYIISSYGARKGLVDTALRTADSGYLTRRLVDVSQDVIVREGDCGTQRGIKIGPMKDGDRTLIPLSDRLFGRVLGEDVKDPKTGEIIGRRNQNMDEALSKKIGSTVDEVIVRSPLTCEAARSVCQSCYGWSLAHGKTVDLGEAVGIIAAQSIGEPGTQLTMRTFHTGGVFTGEVARSIKAESSGQVQLKGINTRKIRTRHGDERRQVEVPGELVLEPKGGGKPTIIPVTPGSLLLVEDGTNVEAGELLVELVSGKQHQKSTEKAAKDVSSDLAGEVVFADLIPEEKTDRQGNMTRIAQRGGLLWVLSGEVYNLPPGAEPVVKNGDGVEPGTVLAETKLVSVSGGVVRLTPGSREIEIITASVSLDRAKVGIESSGGREQYIIETANSQRFLLKATPGTKVQNHSVVAELIDDRYKTATGGIIKYAGVEISKGNRKQGYEIVKGGTLLWIPEESHEVNKDISLLQVEDGEYVEAGKEVVKDIFCQSSGIVEVIQKNDILREIIIKPGELHSEIDDTIVEKFDDRLLQPGTEIMPGVTTSELRYGQIVETTSGMALLLRPVREYTIEDEPVAPSQGSINQEGGRQIELRSVQRLYFKDGERVKSVEGVSLLTTQLILEIDSDSSQEGGDTNANLSADIELVPDEDNPESHQLQMVILESLVLRRDSDSDPLGGTIQTRLLVEDGQEIPQGAVVARTEIQCKGEGEVRGIKEGLEAIRRILIVRDLDRVKIPVAEEPIVKLEELLVAGQKIASGVQTKESAQVVAIDKLDTGWEVTLRMARPYRVSAGAILHIDDGDLVQRGDNLVLLIFERSKTGDIIQGLPRIEELLEARKPKEACVLSRRPGTCQVEYLEDESVELKIIEDDGVITEYPINPGQNLIVSDNQWVEGAEPLTDGPANPHEILDIFFNLYLDEKGVYEAALIGLNKAQNFLVEQVQSVYQSQGIDISDKHIEVIVRQMTNKVRIDDGGDTTMLPGELVELRQTEQVNEAMAITGGAPARYTPMLLGITKASLNTDSFISAASFQETTRVLTEAAIEGKSDWLRGLKENVIIGRLIPAGTGFNTLDESPLAYTGESDGTILRDNFVGRNSAYSSPAERYESLRKQNDSAIADNESSSSKNLNPEHLGEDEMVDDKTARRVYTSNSDSDFLTLESSLKSVVDDDDSETDTDNQEDTDYFV